MSKHQEETRLNASELWVSLREVGVNGPATNVRPYVDILAAALEQAYREGAENMRERAATLAGESICRAFTALEPVFAEAFKISIRAIIRTLPLEGTK